MGAILRIVLLCFVCNVSMATVSSQPAGNQNDDGKLQPSCWQQRPGINTVIQLIDDATGLIKSWFETLATSQLPRQTSPRMDLIRPERSAMKPQAQTPAITVEELQSGQSSFEVYERIFLINQTMKYLKLMYRISDAHQNVSSHNNNDNGNAGLVEQEGSTRGPVGEDLSTAPAETNRVDNWEEAYNELNTMSLPSLQRLFSDVSKPPSQHATKVPLSSLCCSHG